VGLSHRDVTGGATPEEKLAAVRDSANRMGIVTPPSWWATA